MPSKIVCKGFISHRAKKRYDEPSCLLDDVCGQCSETGEPIGLFMHNAEGLITLLSQHGFRRLRGVQS